MGGFGGKFESARQEWETPADFFANMDSEFHFTLDVCADKSNAKCAAYFCPECDGLKQIWEGVCWMNPPYKQTAKWVKKAYESAQNGATVVCLIPARTNTNWWHDYCMMGEVRFIRGRLKFGGAKHGLPQPLAIVIFGDN